MSAVDLESVLDGLRSFQQDAVAHVAHQFYGPGAGEHTGRFLIADETGLGKSVVARGVVAHAIRALEFDDTIKRINVVYICSNRDWAGQNLKRLNVTGQREIAMATRLSLLAKESVRLNQPQRSDTRGSKPINLVSFTPGTSFSSSAWRQGSAEERALVVLLLDQLLQHNDVQRHATRVMFRGTVKSVERFSTHYVEGMQHQLRGEIDPEIFGEFAKLANVSGAIVKFEKLREQTSGDEIPGHLWQPVQDSIAQLRGLLAQASVQTLEPHLVILDEFQRFKSLLDPETGGEAAELADAILSYPGAKVLLLSATPYKPFTQADTDEEDHYEDFLATISFLCRHEPSKLQEVRDALRKYRQSLVSGSDAQTAADDVRATLTPLMTRSERPNVVAERNLVQVRQLPVAVPTAAELENWVALSRFGSEVGSPMNLDYWKSVPHFANYMDRYQISRRLEEHLDGPIGERVANALDRLGGVTAKQVERKARIDVGNGPLRALIGETLDRGWWKMLWMPPSMPYVKPGPIYAQFADLDVTKQVIFSAWSAAPTSIATLLSHEADRRMAGLGGRGLPRGDSSEAKARLVYGPGVGHSTLSLFWPHPGLLDRGDLLSAARSQGETVSVENLEAHITADLGSGSAATQAWEAYFALPDSLAPELIDERFAIDGAQDEEAANTDAFRRGTSQLRNTLASISEHVEQHSGESLRHPDLAWLVAFAPGNTAYRSVRTIAGEGCTPRGIWRAAFTIAEALRTLFNRPESMELLDHLYAQRSELHTYWQRVLAYCADGNLRAVLDEYLFQLWCETGRVDTTDELLLDIARTVASAVGLRPARYVAREANRGRQEFSMPTRFAVRYGGGNEAKSASDADVARQSVVRAGFNSPFAPFVLASTSVGQEGIDFHWWSHAVIHWNLPSNPVDFEQREGRVNRYGGHAVRKNVAAAHWGDVLRSNNLSAWQVAFDAAEKVQTEAGEYSPWWIYPGTAQIQRILAPYPLSYDLEKYEALRSALTLYRLTLGQPRQEDMVEMLQRRGVEGDAVPTIDLRPPRRTSRVESDASIREVTECH